MSRKKLSIHDVLNEDRTQLNESEPESIIDSSQTQVDDSQSSPSKKKRKRGRPPKKVTPKKSSSDTLITTKENKSDYVRLSVTLPPELFDRLQMISIKRRRRKEAYTFCHLVREAIQAWIDQAEDE